MSRRNIFTLGADPVYDEAGGRPDPITVAQVTAMQANAAAGGGYTLPANSPLNYGSLTAPSNYKPLIYIGIAVGLLMMFGGKK